jgi:3-deoxy-D-manno-octulosonic-acid transferase
MKLSNILSYFVCYRFYQVMAFFFYPVAAIWFVIRYWRGKEHPTRWRERFGYVPHSMRQTEDNKKNPLLWIHGASVGEALSSLVLLRVLRERYPHYRLMLTTGTVTSAALLANRLPQGVVHQFVPLDLPNAVDRFLEYHQPRIVLWLESELWPNLLIQAGKRAHVILLNGRMSARSCASWQRFPLLAKETIGSFSSGYAQTKEDYEHWRLLGANWLATWTGNLKYASLPLQADQTSLDQWRKMIGSRPCWALASMHPGEELVALRVHKQLKHRYPNVITILIPRHSDKASSMRQAILDLDPECRVVIQSEQYQGPILNEHDDIYIANRMGEMGLWYQLIPFICMGGSFIPHGGQNPFEPMQLGAIVASGPHMFNFSDMVRSFGQEGVLSLLSDESALCAWLEEWLSASEITIKARREHTLRISAAQADIIDPVLQLLEPYIDLKLEENIHS